MPTLLDLSSASVAAVRRLVGAAPRTAALSELPDHELMTRLGVLLPDGRLTPAGVRALLPAARTVLELVVVHVGGGVAAPADDMSGLSPVEQLVVVETRLDALNGPLVAQSGRRPSPARRIPGSAVREALVNALVHRDWRVPEPVQVVWSQAGPYLEVVSPGGFTGRVTAGSVLSFRHARNPDLAELAGALGLAQQQGVSRMYTEMVVLGHRPPRIREEAGPRVRARLAGGRPLAAVQDTFGAIEPGEWQRDVRVALTVHALLRDGFVAPSTLSPLLQVPVDGAEVTLRTVAECRLDGSPLLRVGSAGLWLATPAVTRRATQDPIALQEAQRRGLLTWWRPDAAGAGRLVQAWLSADARISSGGLAEVTGLSCQGALRILNRLESQGVVQRGDASRGRRASFVAAGG